MRELGRILWLWRGRTLTLGAGLLISLAALACGIALMAMAGTAVAMAFLGLLAVPAVLRAVGVGRVVLRYFERLVTHDATFRALADLRVWFFRGLARSAAGGLGFRQAGDVLARLVGDVEALDGLYLRILLPLTGALLVLPSMLFVLARYQGWIAAPVGLLFAGAAFVLPWLAARRSASLGERLAAVASDVRIVALDALTGLREVRAFSAEGRMLALLQAREADLLSAQRELAQRTALAGVGAFLCGQAAIFCVLLAAAGKGAVAIPAAFLTVAAFEAAAGLPRAGSLAGHAVAAARRVMEAAEMPPAVADPQLAAAPPMSASLTFEHVRFRWLADRPLVFDGLTLEVPQGSRVALLGPSGAGKSTLAALALKVAAPEHGRVLLGGVDLADLQARVVRQRIGWLSQATHLFDDTIRANLRLGRTDADDVALWAALDAARIGEVVRALPDGLDTWVGEGGARFSGGQGRRLALARVLLSQAPVLILDEPCSGLDAKTERAFLTTLNEVAAGRTVLLIAHRLTGVEQLDRIWRLSGGHAVAAAA